MIYYAIFIFLVSKIRGHHPNLSFRIISGTSSGEYSDFVVAFFFLTSDNVCTAGLISSRFALTAAHCLRENGVPIYDDENCVNKALKKNRKHIKKCTEMEDGDVRIRMNPKGAWLIRGEPDLAAIDIDNSLKHYIKYIYRPKGTYYGGEYLTRGGYDILLLKLFKMSAITDQLESLLILPHPLYDDVVKKAIAVGYGTSNRIPCEVNNYGPEKFDYCGLPETECEMNEFCDITFPYDGKILKGCQTDRPTPAEYDEKCKEIVQKFQKMQAEATGIDYGYETDAEYFDYEGTTDARFPELFIFNTSKHLIHKCYGSDPSTYGWCGTPMPSTIDTPWLVSDGYSQDFFINSDSGWGYCQRECSSEYKEEYIDPDSISGTGAIRRTDLDVLDNKFCMEKLMENLHHEFGSNSTFELKPKIICAAKNYTYETGYYELKKDNKLTKFEPDHKVLKAIGRDPNWYVRQAGKYIIIFILKGQFTPEIKSVRYI